MATLTETAYVTRKIINIGVIVVIIGIIVRIFISGVTGIWQTLFPPPPLPATMTFGQLPYPAAQNNIATPSGTITYTLETADMGLPALPNTLRVYFMPPSSSSFSSFERMKNIAGQLGFRDVPQRVSATAWRFVDKDNPLRLLDIDEVSLNFRMTYNYLSDQSLFNDKNFSSTDGVAGEVRSYFSGLGILPQEFAAGTPIVSFYKFDAGALSITTALANADAISVTLTRADVDTGSEAFGKIPVVSPDYRQGLVSALVSGSNNSKKRILEARFLVGSVDQENWATYTPIGGEEAFNRLKSGRAIFASLPDPMINNITVRKVYLAYLDPYPSQNYLQPVMVFSDERGFVAYVPLVTQ